MLWEIREGYENFYKTIFQQVQNALYLFTTKMS